MKLYYLWNFSVNLKLFHNKADFKNKYTRNYVKVVKRHKQLQDNKY